MTSERKIGSGVIIGIVFLLATTIGLGFRDCRQQREAREACLANPLRSAAECLQAFPERR